MSVNLCGRAFEGGCDDPDMTHPGPCTFKHETPEQQAVRHARNLRKKSKYVARKKARKTHGK